MSWFSEAVAEALGSTSTLDAVAKKLVVKLLQKTQARIIKILVKNGVPQAKANDLAAQIITYLVSKF